MKTKIILLTSFIFLLTFFVSPLTSLVFAQDGTLDTSFDTDGKVITDFSQANNYAESVAIQSDGKIIVVGTAYNGSNRDFAITRYNSDGSLDATFKGNGKLTTDIVFDVVYGGGQDEAQDVAIQSDGKIIVVGWTSSLDGSDYFAVVRYNSDGSLDNTFSGDGMTITSFGTDYQQAFGVAIQPDGKIVIVGNVQNFNTGAIDFAVARYNTDGSLDTSFDGDGTLTTDFNNGGNDLAEDVVIQSDGKIIVVGRTYDYNYIDGDIALVRYNSDGSLDTSFDTDGKLTTDFGAGYDYGYAVALQTDGKILVSGQVSDASFDNFGLVRYNNDGSLDTSFDTDGKVLTNFTSYSYGYDMAIQSDGKILVGGTTYNPTLSKDVFAVAKYNSDGSLDTSFDTDGKTTASFNSNDNTGKGIAIQSDGKIILAGKSYNGNNDDFAVLRYNNSVSSSISVDIKIFMEGPYNSPNMNASLTLPTTSPYTEDQETVTSIPSIQGNQVVDWVLVQLRDKTDESIILESQSAFILQDGSVVDLDGSSPVGFSLSADSYYLSVKHRNHLSVMSATPVSFTN